MKESFFIELMKSGQIRIENGVIVIFKGHNILFPVRSFLKLRELLIKKFGEEEGNNFLREIGRYQIKQALVRYSKIFKIEQMEKVKIEEFGLKIMELLGLGKFEVVLFSKSPLKIIIQSKNVPISTEYEMIYGKSNKPIDSYVCGIWEEGFSRFINVPMKCIETKCIACGDPYCQFEIYPTKEEK